VSYDQWRYFFYRHAPVSVSCNPWVKVPERNKRLMITVATQMSAKIFEPAMQSSTQATQAYLPADRAEAEE